MIIKKITINFILFLLLFAIFDLIFSNFIYKETFRYACYKYDIDFYSLQTNCVAIEKHEPTNKNFKVYTDENGHRFLGQKKDSDKNKTVDARHDVSLDHMCHMDDIYVDKVAAGIITL